MQIEIIDISSPFYTASLNLRNEALRIPLGMDISNEDLSDDKDQVQFVAIEDNEIVGIVMLVPHYKKRIGKLRQMATSGEVRGKGYGIKLVKALEEYAIKNEMVSISLHSRHYAVGFYKKLGYEITSSVFQEVGINHYVMQKNLITD